MSSNISAAAYILQHAIPDSTSSAFMNRVGLSFGVVYDVVAGVSVVSACDFQDLGSSLRLCAQLESFRISQLSSFCVCASINFLIMHNTYT
jgi:hypothetical protein